MADWLGNIRDALQGNVSKMLGGSTPQTTPQAAGGGGFDMGQAFMEMLKNQMSMHSQDLMHFGHQGKPMTRLTLGGHIEGSPEAANEGLNGFYKMNPHLAGANRTSAGAGTQTQPPPSGQMSTQPPPPMPASGGFFNPQGTSGMNVPPNATMAFSNQFGTGNNAPQAGGGQMPVGGGYNAQLGPVLEAMRKAQAAKPGATSSPWAAFLPNNGAGVFSKPTM